MPRGNTGDPYAGGCLCPHRGRPYERLFHGFGHPISSLDHVLAMVMVGVMRRLLRFHYGAEGNDFAIEDCAAPTAIRRAISDYFLGDLCAINSIPVTTGGTSFQREVWAALRTIQAGTTLSYGALARQLGRPKSVRAVGLANAANPVAIVVPCHRVIGTDGSLTGYGGGISRKRWLLVHEGVALEKFATRRIPEAA